MNLHKHSTYLSVNVRCRCRCRLKVQSAGQVTPQNFRKFESNTMVLLKINSTWAWNRGGGQGHQRPSSANFEVYFWALMHKERILGIMGGQNQAKVTKGYQVQIFKKSILELLCIGKEFWASWEVKIRSRSWSAYFQNVYFGAPMHRKAFWASWEVKIMSSSPKVIKCNFLQDDQWIGQYIRLAINIWWMVS